MREEENCVAIISQYILIVAVGRQLVVKKVINHPPSVPISGIISGGELWCAGHVTP